MEIIKSGARFSSIVDIGIRLKQKSIDTNTKVLAAHRGINAVTTIDLSQVIKRIDFNSTEIQNYPPSEGHSYLRKAINQFYFENEADNKNIFITIGSVLSLNLAFSILNASEVLLPEFFWGAYANILKINKKTFSTYSNFDYLLQNADKFQNKAVVICEPSNPLGNSESDSVIFQVVEALNKNGVTIIVDSPYRRVFNSDLAFYKQMLDFENVILLESFSKCLGLSGQRIGFLHSTNKEFNQEFRIQLLYATNGVNAFAQRLIFELLSSDDGKKAVNDFLEITKHGINKNIKFLHEKKLLPEIFYQKKLPLGIFAVVNKSQEFLFQHNIGAVNLSFFHTDKQKYQQFSRICVSLNPDEFELFFSKL